MPSRLPTMMAGLIWHVAIAFDPSMSPSTKHLTSEQRFHLFLEAACDYAIFFTDTNSDICEWSSGGEKIIGYTESEALQLNARVIFTEEDRVRGVPEQEMENAIRNGQANDERWHVRKDGSLFFAVGRLVALKDSSGHLYGFAKIVRDATPHKNLEKALHASDQQFRATFAQAPLGMVLTDLSGRIDQVNRAFCELTGFTDVDLDGKDLLSFTAPEDRDGVRRHINEILIGKRNSFIMEKRMKRADGAFVWVKNSGALLRDAEGRPLSFIDLCQDISALKLSTEELGQLIDQRTSALEDKTRQMESFCYTVAHDLRAPLRAIAGYAKFLHEDFSKTLPSEGLDYLRRIEASAARLDRLIIDLLGYTRVQQVPLIQEEVDLSQVVERVIEQMRAEIDVEGLVIDVVHPLGKVRADGATLDHIFSDLISNAVKFRRQEASPVVKIYSEDRDGHLRVWVEDNGVGIDPRFKERIFGMFERLHPERKTPGTGIGLAIVATAMERFGGTRGVEPNHPEGSRFWIEFPK
jgi:PAS domain S-box-containing protein